MPPDSTDTQAVTRFLYSLCSLDTDQMIDQFTRDARVTIGDSVLAAGTSQIMKLLKRSMASLVFLHVTPAMIWTRGNVSVIEADVNCELLDGSRASLPATLILCFRDKMISDVRLFTYEPAVPLLGSTRLAAHLAAGLRHTSPADPVRPAPPTRTAALGFRVA